MPGWAIEIVAVGAVDVGAIAWRESGAVGVTLIAKSTFALEQGVATTVEPAPLVRADHHRERDPRRSVEAGSDLAVYRPWCDVTVVGHVYAPPGMPSAAMIARLGVFRGRDAILDKSLRVFGDRDLTAGAAPRPFQAMPLQYERAAAGDDNPIGVAAGSTKLPNIVDARGPSALAGFGPIPRAWPIRRKLLAGRNVDFDAPVIELGDAFPFAFFQAAPPDQRIGFLRGDEWIVLDGMHRTLPRVQTKIPGARAAARVATHGPEGVKLQRVNLVADTLAIDADRGIASIVWRGRVTVAGAHELQTMRAVIGVEMPGAAIAWPDLQAMAAPSPAAPSNPNMVTEPDGGTTLILRDDRPQQPATPFEAARSPEPTTTHEVKIVEAPTTEDPRDEPQHTLFNVTLDDIKKGANAPFAITPASSADAPPRSTSIPWRDVTPPPIAGADDESTITGHAMQRPEARPPEPVAVAPEELRPPLPFEPTPPPASRFFHTPERGAGLPVAEREVALEAPKRKAFAIPTFASPSLAVGTMPWQVKPPEDSLTILVKATCDLVPDGKARLCDESDPPIGEVHLEDDETKSTSRGGDWAILKPKVDVTAVGRAYASAGARAAIVEMSVGSIRRRVAVFGDRRWRSSAMTDPAAFTSIPLAYERAFGGPKHTGNPSGVGFKGAGEGALPNLEDPDRLITSPNDAPPVACFAPIPIAWPERTSKMGTYGGRWLKTRWPYFPEDFDYRYFQHAPEKQQLEKARGDERFSFVGMRPDTPRLDGELPGIRARAFLDRSKDGAASFDEVELKLDTISFDLEAMKLELVWRGLAVVSEEEAPEVNAVFALHEPLEGPSATVAEARDRYLAMTMPREDIEEIEPLPRANDTEPPPNEEDAAMAALEAQQAEREKKLMDELLAAGVDLDAPPPDVPAPTPEKMAEAMKAAGASEEQIAELFEAMKPANEDEAGPAPAIDLRAAVIARLAENAPLDGLDLEGADLSDLDFTERSLKGTNLRKARLMRATFDAAKLDGAVLEGADLEDARFDGASLEGADFSEARLERASLEGAKLEGADFSRAKAKDASFKGASGKGVQLAGADLTGARFDGASLTDADLTRATIDRASFRGAVMPGVRLYDAKGSEVVLDDAKMPGARAEGVKLERSSAKNADLTGAIFELADVRLTTFFGAHLAGASFERADCEEAVFTTCDLREARLRRANLSRAVLLKANAMNALFERADLSFADLRGANLHATEVWRAKLEGAKLDLAIVTQSKLSKGPWTP